MEALLQQVLVAVACDANEAVFIGETVDSQPLVVVGIVSFRQELVEANVNTVVGLEVTDYVSGLGALETEEKWKRGNTYPSAKPNSPGSDNYRMSTSLFCGDFLVR